MNEPVASVRTKRVDWRSAVLALVIFTAFFGHTGPASAQMQTYNYITQAFSASLCEAFDNEQFPTVPITCISGGNGTFSVTFNNVPAGYTGTATIGQIAEWSADADVGVHLKTGDWMDQATYFEFVNGEIVAWYADVYDESPFYAAQQSTPPTQEFTSFAGPGYDGESYDVYISYVPGLNGANNPQSVAFAPNPGTWSNGNNAGNGNNSWVNAKALGASCDLPGRVTCGNPVDIGTGNKYEQISDYETAGENKLSLIRYYNSLASSDTSAASLGHNWRTNYDHYLHILSSGVQVERPDGQIVDFTLNGNTWTPDTDVDMKLTNSGTTWTLTDHDDTVETYTAANGVAILNSIKLRNGYTQTLAYTGGALASVTDSYNRSLVFAYAGTLLHSVTTPDSLVLTYGFTTAGSSSRLASVTYNTSPVTSQTYLYENASYPFALTGITDENGNRFATWAYDMNGRAISSQHAGGADAIQVAYDDATGNRTVTGPLGIQETYKFTTLQGVPKITEIDRAANGTVTAATRSFSYDANGYTALQSDWNGNVTATTNNAHGQPVQIVYGQGSPVAHATAIAYDATWVHLPKTITTPGLTVANTYDTLTGNLLIRTLTDTTTQIAPYSTSGQSWTWTYAWTATGQIQSVKLPRADVTAKTNFSYTGGTLSSVTDALRHVTTVKTYKPGGLPLTITDPNKVLTTRAYTPRNWLTSSVLATEAGNLTTSMTYDAAGDLTRTTLPDNSFLSYAYDAAHRLIAVANPLNETENLTLDAMGHVTQTLLNNALDVNTLKHAAGFDAIGRPLTDVGGAGQQTQFAYDSQGNILAVTDPLSHVSRQSFDALNRLSSATDAANDLSATTYDAHDRPLRVTDPRGNTTSYVYDGFGEVIQQTSPDTGATVFHYDADGNVISKTDAASNVTDMTYDALDRLLTKTYPADSALNAAFKYDESGHGKGIGRLTSFTDQSGALSRSYDERGNIVKDVRTINGTAYTTATTYDPASRIASIAYLSGWTIGYTRDGAGQIKTVTATRPGHAAVNLATNVTHAPFGPLNGLIFGNGVTDARSFDLDYLGGAYRRYRRRHSRDPEPDLRLRRQ